MPSRVSLLAIVAVAAAVACTAKQEAPAKPDTTSATAATASADPAAVRQAIEAANTKQFAAARQSDTAGMAANYTADAILMMPNEKVARGHDEIAKAFAGMFSQATLKDPKLVTTDLIVNGDLAIETGTYDWTVQPKKGKAVHDVGKYLTVWKRQPDGSWKIIRDIGNADPPAK
jgi:uncharacterized protein (TIGR02246 family)